MKSSTCFFRFIIAGAAVGLLIPSGYIGWRQPVMVTRVPVVLVDPVLGRLDPVRVSKTLGSALVAAPQTLDALGPVFGDGQSDRPHRALGLLKADAAAHSTDARRAPIRLAGAEIGSAYGSKRLTFILRSAPVQDKAVFPAAVDDFLAKLEASYNSADRGDSKAIEPALSQEMALVRLGMWKSQLDSAIHRAAIAAGVSSSELQFHAAAVDATDLGALANSTLGAIIAAKGNPEHWLEVWGPKIAELRLAASDLSISKISIRDLPYARLPVMKVAGEPVYEIEVARDVALAVVAILVGGGLGLLTGVAVNAWRRREVEGAA